MLSNCIAEVKRLVYEDKVAKWKETIWSYSWYLTAVNEESEVLNDSKFWKAYKLSICSLVDIKETDSIVIDWVEYSVKWVAQRHWWSLALTTVILELWQ